MKNIIRREDYTQKVLASLEAIHRSAGFSTSPQMYSFLEYVVTQKLEGKESRIKAYSVALDALGRSKSFDPQADPIVRVVAGRLRSALKVYYSENGMRDPIRIEIPKGTYQPIFIDQSPPTIEQRIVAFVRKLISKRTLLQSNFLTMLLTSLCVITFVQLYGTSSTAKSNLIPAIYDPGNYDPGLLTIGACQTPPGPIEKWALQK